MEILPWASWVEGIIIHPLYKHRDQRVTLPSIKEEVGHSDGLSSLQDHVFEYLVSAGGATLEGYDSDSKEPAFEDYSCTLVLIYLSVSLLRRSEGLCWKLQSFRDCPT